MAATHVGITPRRLGVSLEELSAPVKGPGAPMLHRFHRHVSETSEREAAELSGNQCLLRTNIMRVQLLFGYCMEYHVPTFPVLYTNSKGRDAIVSHNN